MSHIHATVAYELSWAATELAAQGIANPRLDAEVLLAHSLNTNRAGLYTHLHTVLSPPQIEAFQQLLHRRLQREPVQYITGVQEFWSLEFAVDRRVLIPRPETELAVSTVLQLLNSDERQRFSPHPGPLPKGAREFSGKILDVGTGSGCIAIALATELPDAVIWATDISAEALTVAETNARRHNVHQRVRFFQGDLFAPVAGQQQAFDIIVSNPPYITTADLLTLQPEVRDWEPQSALDGGEEGVDFYRRLLSEASHSLRVGGWLVLEIGHDQSPVVLHLIKEQPEWTGRAAWADSFCLPDYAGYNRVVAVQKS